MNAHIIYNAHRNDPLRPSPEDISNALADAGYQPICHLTNSPLDLEKLFKNFDGIDGVVVAAGGDGTIRETAIRLMDRHIPLVPLPMGTANNICNTLGVTGDTKTILSHLGDPVRVGYDIGQVQAPWGDDYFVETAGYGLYAEILAAYDPEKGKSVLRALTSISTSFTRHSEREREIRIDGQDASGRYMLVEVHNTPAFGPRIQLAKEADPTDGLLDVVLVQEEAYENFSRYLAGFLRNETEEMPVFQVQRARQVEITWDGFPTHVDAHVRPEWLSQPDGRSDYRPPAGRRLPQQGKILIQVKRAAVEFWLPSFVRKGEGS